MATESTHIGRGGVPKPRALKMLDGDKRPSHQRPYEPVPDEVEIVPDRNLSPEAKALWDKLAPGMIRKKVLTYWDAPAFCELLEAMQLARFYRAEMVRQLGGASPPKGQRDAVAHYARVMGVLAMGWSRFGMTPGDRARLINLEFEGKSNPSTGPQDLLSG